MVVKQRKQLDNYEAALGEQTERATEVVHAYLERGYVDADVHDRAVEALENCARLLSNDFQCSTNAQYRQHF